ncbi:MAG: multicopper oxidase domain-containing protein [Actinomycetota bacterium]
MNNDERSVLAVGGFGLGVVSLAFAGFAISRSGDSGSAGSISAAATTTAVDVNLTEFSMTPNMLDVPPGDVTIHVTNSGTVAHNFSIAERNLTTRDLQPGEAQTITLKNAAAGELTFQCSIPGHAASGMKGMIHVAAANSASAASAPPTTMSYQAMDKAMSDRALRFVNEPKSTFGGTPLQPKILADGTKEFDLTTSIVDWEVEPGKIVKAWTYNGMVPGPSIRVEVGDKVRVVLKNELPESTDIHFHGIRVPNAMDGVDPFTQDPVQPGKSFTYEFTALEPAVGMYHSHHDAQTQIPNGLAGAFIIGDMPLPASLADKGITKIDQTVNMMLNDAGTIGLSLNGKSFPATEPYSAKVGDTMLVNYFNEGLTAHPMHMHQPVGWIIAKDGVPLKEPMAEDTILVAPGERYTVVYHFTDPGVWAWHCHILTHAEGPQGMFGMVTAVIVK